MRHWVVGNSGVMLSLESAVMPVMIGGVVVFDLIAHSGVAVCSPSIALIEERLHGRIFVMAGRLTGAATSYPTGRIVVVIGWPDAERCSG